MNSAEDFVWFEDRIVPRSQATINVLAPAVTSGPIPYETLRGYWNAELGELFLFRGLDHFRRLRHSARILRFTDLPLPDRLVAIAVELARVNGHQHDIHYRVFAYPVDIDRPSMTIRRSSVVIEVRERRPKPVVPARSALSPWRRGGDDSQPARVKAMGIRMFARAAMVQALADGYDQLLLLNERGKVSESVQANLFMVRDGVLYTPESTASLLNGITRDTLLKVLPGHGMACVEREIDYSELIEADEVFLCSTGYEVLPIGSIDGIAVGTGGEGPATRTIRDIYGSVVRAEAGPRPDWHTGIYGPGPEPFQTERV